MPMYERIRRYMNARDVSRKVVAINMGITESKLSLTFDLQAHADIPDMIRKYSADPVRAAWLNSYPEADRGKEMMAEYVKTWLQDRAAAVQFGGQSFTDYFENSLNERDWLKPMQTAAQDMRAYLAATSGERAKASIDLVENGKNVDKYAKGLKGLAKAVFDRTLPLTQLTDARRATEGDQFNASKDVRTLALAKESTIANMVSECLYGKNMVDPEGNTVTDLDGTSIGSLGGILGQVDRRQEKDFNALWALLHAKDRQAVGKAVFGKNIDVDAAIQQIESANPELRQVIDQAEDWYTTFMQIWTVETGMIDQETFDTLRKTYPHYVPTFRSGANLDDFVQTAIRTQNSPGNGLKTAKGATSNLYNPVMGLVEYVQRYIANYKNVEVLRAFDDTMRNIPGLEGIAEPVQGDMQRTDNRSANEQARQTVQQTVADMLKSGNITPEGETALLDALDTLPEQGWIATDRATGNDVLNIPMQDGSISRYTVYNAPILKAILGQPASRRAKWLRAAARCTGFLCSMATGRNLGFAGQNWFSDSETAMNTGHAAGTWITYIPLQLMTMANYLKNTINDKRGANVDEAYRLFQTFGKMGSRFAFRDTKTQAEARRSLYGGNPRVSEVLKSIITSPLVGLENISGFIEDSTRYNEFRNSGHDLSTYSGKLEAGKGAREATVDFTKSGDAEDLKYAKGVVPFLGAQLQGIYKTARLFSSENAGNRVRTAGRILVNGVLFSLVMKAIRNLTWDDDEKDAYDQMTPYERNKYWHIKQEDGTFVRIKRSQDAIIQIADAAGEWLGNVLTGYEADWGDLMAIANEIGHNAVIGFDTVFDPFFDAANNKTWYGGAIEDNRMEEMSTTGRYTEETSPVYRTLSYTLNALGVKYSPLDVEYIVKQFTSSMGKTGSGILGLAESGELTIGNVLSTIGSGIGDSYMTDPVYTNNISGTFYTGKTALEQMVNEAKQGRAPEGFRADLTQEESNAALAEGTALTSKGGAVYDTYKATKDLWKQHDDILNNPNMTEEDRTAAAREVRRQINTAMLQGNAVIAGYIKKYGYTGDVEQNVQNMLSSLNGGKAVPIAQTALDTLPDTFKADADEPYMKQATALWQATGKDSALPNPNTSFTVNGTKYEIGSADWGNFTAKYKQAYVSYLAQNSAGWDALSAEDQLEIMSKAHTAGTNAAKKWYMKLHQIK